MSAVPVADDALEPASLVELAVRRLRAEILSGALAPGERLVEEQLTRRFGISRAPLREALRLLGQQGLVEHLPRRGVRVVELSARDITELFSLRDVLEQFAVRHASSDPGLPARLPGLATTLRTMEASADAAERANAHRAFHVALVALADHHHLLRTYEPVLLQLQVYMATNLRREAANTAEAGDEPSVSSEAVRRHRRLYDAVASGDVDLALRELGSHGARTYLAPELAP